MTSQQAPADYAVIDEDLEAFRDSFPDIEDLTDDTLRMIMLRAKLDLMCLAVHNTKRGFATARQREIIDVLGKAIRAIIKREVFKQVFDREPDGKDGADGAGLTTTKR